MSPALAATPVELAAIAERRLASTALASTALASTALAGARFESAEAVVRWFGAFQGQEYGPAKWGLGQRLKPGPAPVTDAMVEAEFDSGRIVRTHVLRPTWHLVAVDDLPWLLELTGHRVEPKIAYYDKQIGLDTELSTRARPIILAALEEVAPQGIGLNRRQLAQRLAAEGIETTGAVMSHLMIHAELAGEVCSGPRAGRHHTYRLLGQRLRDAGLVAYAPPSREEGLGRLVETFFRSHGPATSQDFRWWSGLTDRDLRVGLEAAGSPPEVETIGGVTFWAGAAGVPGEAGVPGATGTVQLLQAFDEFTVAYTQSKPACLLRAPGSKPGMMSPFLHTVIEGSQVVGHWRYTTTTRQLSVETELHVPDTKPLLAGLEAETARLAAYFGLAAGPVTHRPR